MKHSSVCVWMSARFRFSSSRTAGRTTVKLSTIHRFPEVGIIRNEGCHDDIITKTILLKVACNDREKRLFSQKKASLT